MITRKQLQEHIDAKVFEALNEYMPQFGGYDFEEKEDKDDEDIEDVDDDDELKKDEDDSELEHDIMQWLNSAQELHSVLAYDLFPDMTKDAARSYFSKKWRHKEGKHFDIDEINRLFDIKDKFIKKITESISKELKKRLK